MAKSKKSSSVDTVVVNKKYLSSLKSRAKKRVIKIVNSSFFRISSIKIEEFMWTLSICSCFLILLVLLDFYADLPRVVNGALHPGQFYIGKVMIYIHKFKMFERYASSIIAHASL